ncbi:MAG: TonB-dependent receptor [Cytophagales bacterium]|nr:TonB-dependent receptor [Cytophagales bacterium]
MKHFNVLLLFVAISYYSTAQTIVSGVVKGEDDEPLPGVTIIEKGTQNGNISDVEGRYSVRVNEGATLIFSFVGYVVEEVPVNGRATIDVSMTPSILSLKEIVVVGYGEQEKASVLSAIDKVDGEQLQEVGSPNLINALSGMSPGLNVVIESGKPGGEDGDIFVRGMANPLILVDGVEIVGGFSNIDHRDVENISILKDGAATAVYGMRGANGVIIITTKRGTEGRPKITWNSEYTIKSPVLTPEVLGACEAQSALNAGILNDQAYGAGYSSEQDLAHWREGDLPYIYPDTDWFDLLLKKSVASHNHNVGLRGGNKFVKYYASAGFLQEGDIVRTAKFFNYDPEFDFKRYSFRANLDFELTKTTTLKSSIHSRYEAQNQPRISGNNQNNFKRVFGGAYLSAPGGVVPLYPAEVMEEYPDELYPGLAEPRFGSGANLFADLNTAGLTKRYHTVFNADFELQQNLDFLTKGLKLLGRYNLITNYRSAEGIAWNGVQHPRIDTYTLERDGSWFSFEGRNYERPYEHNLTSENLNNSQENTYYQVQLRYKNKFDKHNVSAMALFARLKRIQGTNFPLFNEDWVGRATYNYDYRYFVEINGSYNGDETFAEGYRFMFFPSFALGYNLANESFIRQSFDVLSNFKIRYSYGQTGQKSGLDNARWQYLSFYDVGSNNRYFFGEDLTNPLRVIFEDQIGNPTLTWATVAKQNLGVEFGFFDDKISGNLEFFEDRRKNLIRRPSGAVPSYVGSVAPLPFANLDETKRHGWELELTYRNTTSGGFKYSVGGFYGFNENRIVRSVADGAETPEYSRVAGKPGGAVPLLQTDGYFQNIDEVVNYPEFAGKPGLGDYRYIDYNANGTVIGNANEDQVRFDLPRAPKNSYSIRLSASYKGFSVSAMFNGVIGYEGLIISSLAYALPEGEAAGRPEHLDYWTPSNPDAAYPALHVTNNPNLFAPHTSRIMNFDFLKLRNANISYDFKTKRFKNISSLRLYVNGNNLITISDIDFGDPEGQFRGGLYPVVRRVNFGIRVGF